MRYPVVLLLLAATCGLLSVAIAVEPPEYPPVQCIEGPAQHLEYGDRLVGCEINTPSDMDFFTFDGVVGDMIRVTVSIRPWQPVALEPLIDIRDPFNVTVLYDACEGDCTNTVTLAETGTYQILVFDSGYDEAGPYTFQIERIRPISYAVGMQYDVSRTISLNHPMDRDQLRFPARAGTEVRLVANAQTLDLDPRVVFQRPDGTGFDGIGCSSSGSQMCSFWYDVTLTESGFHFLEWRDNFLLKTGTVEFVMYCLFGLCPRGYLIEDVEFASPTELSWSPTSDPDATYDLVRGDLRTLRSTRGDFATAVLGCPSTGNVLPVSDAFDDLDSGQGVFYVVRAVHEEIGVGSYDTAGPSQLSRQGGRDTGPMGIDSSPDACGQSAFTVSFVPDEPSPGADTVSMAEGVVSGPTVAVDVNVTDTSDVYAASFDVTFDSALFSFVGWDQGELLEQGGATVNYSITEPQAGVVVVGASRIGDVGGADAVGAVRLISLTFEALQVGSTPLFFQNAALFNSQNPPQPIQGVAWYGGTIVAY